MARSADNRLMAAIAKISLENAPATGGIWAELVSQTQGWAVARQVSLRDAVLLVPFAQLLPLARHVFAQAGGWMPRIETTQTLARSLGPAEPADPLQISFDTALDGLSAARLLRGQGWARTLGQGDPGAFEQMVSAVVQTAHALARAGSAVPPADREAHWSHGRAQLGATTGPGARERLLARVAFEWAAASAAPATDALFALRPSAWIVVQAGGVDPLTASLLEQADAATPCLCLDTDATADDPFGRINTHVSPPQVAVCDSFEDEAQRSAAQVLVHLENSVAPIALIALDRTLVRRVRALLARQNVPLHDETGWRLSTTRAGATLASLLWAAAPRSSTDDWLDWIKSCIGSWPGLPGGMDAESALRGLEADLRRQGRGMAFSVSAADLAAPAATLWHAAQRAVANLTDGPAIRPLGQWLAALRQALQACGAHAPLLADDAGRQLLAALHLADERPVFDSETMTFQAFSRWVDATLEASSFRPAPPVGDAKVVVTPLEQAMLRPFAAVVFPGADEKRLGAPASPHPLLSDTLATELGLPSAAARRNAEVLAFVQVLRHPNVTLLRRADDGGEPIAASPLLERLNLALRRAGQTTPPSAPDPSREVVLPRRSVMRPLPAAPELLPTRLSASACEALRACPYRFFALRLLRLRADEELDDAVEKRDYGTWLHAVLHRFHSSRGEAPDAATDEARLHAVAIEVRREMALDDAAFLPFEASFARLVPPYLAWLHGRDAIGARWLDGEVDLRARPTEWNGIEMHGVIDRVDSVPADDAASGPVTQLIDYKTSSAQKLRTLVKQPQEDTQLAFYAALMAQQSEAAGDIGACYLPLDDGDTVKAIEHADVEATARQLVAGLGRDLARLRDGAPMPALGEGSACEHCDARGLCRRDHWAAATDVAGDTP